jgi:hypothetical protein
MIELSRLTVLLLGELLIALLVISGTLGFLSLKRKGRTRNAARHLAERVQADKPPRMERLKQLLAERYGYAGSELDQAVHDITQAEMRLYQNIVNGFIKDDQLSLQLVDVDVENLVLAYQSLNVPNAAVKTAPSPATGDDEEMQRLREENTRLSEELKVTMDTMGRMLNEYSSMFSGGSDNTYEKARIPEESDAEATDADAVQVEAGVSSTDHDLLDDDDFAIPDYSSDEAMSGAAASEEWSDAGQEDEDDRDVVDEVSGIIDEVMGIADEMSQETHEEKQPSVSESLMDELEQVDIEIPEVEESEQEDETPEPGSLEEEWAKLLEEDAASSKETKPDS